jgi:hypothetical protein
LSFQETIYINITTITGYTFIRDLYKFKGDRLMKKDLWSIFEKSGKVEDYLKYKG